MATINGNSRFAGTSVRQITPDLAEEMGLPYDAKGVMVTEVEPGSPADQMGLAVDDIILSLNDVPMDTAQGLQGYGLQSRAAPGSIVLQRDGRRSRA